MDNRIDQIDKLLSYLLIFGLIHLLLSVGYSYQFLSQIYHNKQLLL
jgi:hypothetical protein